MVVPGHPRFSPHVVDTVAFSPDGKLIAAGTDDMINRIVLADVETTKVVRSLTVSAAEDWRLTSLAFSPDGKQLATNAGAGAAIWDVASGRIVRQLQQPSGGVSKLVFSPDGRRLAGVTFYAGAICVWDLQTGEQFGADRPGHFESPNSLRFFNQDQQLASAGDDGTVRIWNLADSKQLRAMQHVLPLNRFDRWIRAMDVSPDGKYVVSSSLDNTVRLWETATGSRNLPAARPWQYGRKRNQSGAFQPRQRAVRLVGRRHAHDSMGCGNRQRLQEFEIKLDGPAPNGPGDNPFDGPSARPQIDSASFSGDLTTLLTISGHGPQGKAFRYSVIDGEELSKNRLLGMFSTRAALLPGNVRMLMAGWNGTQVIKLPDGVEKHVQSATYPVEVWSLADERIIASREFPGHGADKVAYSPDGRFAAIAVIGDQPKIDLCTIPDLADAGQIELPSAPGRWNSPLPGTYWLLPWPTGQFWFGICNACRLNRIASSVLENAR